MDPYQSPDTQEAAVINAMIQRLEDRGENDLFNGFIDQYLSGVNDGSLRNVLDLGCGTGVVTRRIAKNLTKDVKVTGVDISAKLLDKARELSNGELMWQQCDGVALPFEDEVFDLIVMHTLLTHVPDPVAVLKEANRVLASGGKIVIFDADYASTTYAIDDFAKGRETDIKLLGAVVHNLDVCRMMPRYIKSAGLALTNHTGHLISEVGKGDFWLSSVQGFSKLIPALDILPEEEGRSWVRQMLESHENGTFFAAGNYYTYFVTKL